MMDTMRKTILGLSSVAGLGIAVSLLMPQESAASPKSSTASEADTISLLGVVRDFRPSPDLHPDFDDPHLHGPYVKSVKTELDGDGKPDYSSGTGRRMKREYRDGDNNKICWCLDPQEDDNEGEFGDSSDGAIHSSETFSQWFRDTPGENLSTTWTMTLELETSGPYAGAYSFETNDFLPFYPIDGELFGNGNDTHNFFFTYEMHCDFTYDASAEQFVKFKGDDDTWIFIDGKLVMDHGGIAGSREYFIGFDRLGLADGEDYELVMFHAERKQPQSQFHLWTNVGLRSAGSATVMNPYD